MDGIRIDCSTETCPNYEVIHRDDPIPSDHEHWRCSTCEDALAEQEATERARYYHAHVTPTQENF